MMMTGRVEDQAARREDTLVVLRHCAGQAYIAFSCVVMGMCRIGRARGEQDKAQDRLIRDDWTGRTRKLSIGVVLLKALWHPIISVPPAQLRRDRGDCVDQAAMAFPPALIQRAAKVDRDRLLLWQSNTSGGDALMILDIASRVVRWCERTFELPPDGDAR